MSDYRLSQHIALPPSDSAPGVLQIFPWTTQSVNVPFDGKWRAEPAWHRLLHRFHGAVLVGRDKRVHVIFPAQPSVPAISFVAPNDGLEIKERPQVAWALRSTHPFDVLVILAHNRCIFIWDVQKRKLVGYLRGHGGLITSIAVCRSSPNIFATTSTDMTTRVYDLDILHEVPQKPNPVWIPWTGPSTAGAAHGLDTRATEGSGIGRCTVLLAGGIYGGHASDVLGAAFHPRLPLIATCGVDHYVKIWRCAPGRSRVENKPLFSALVSSSRILSIAWLSDDLLLVHTGTTFTPSAIPTDDSDSDEQKEPETDASKFAYTKTESGQLIALQWLGLRRFFPDGRSDIPIENTRSISTDSQQSNSYSMIASLSLNPPLNDQREDYISNIAQQSCAQLVFVYPNSVQLRIVNLTEMIPSSLAENTDTVTRELKRVRLDTPPLPARAAGMLENHVAAAGAVTASGGIVILDTENNIWVLEKVVH
ncbi:hypothetical protein C8F01DRAFT_1109068, partial [Mycena amicta]